nr:hypothetical protein [Methylotetracoccus oryzae]
MQMPLIAADHAEVVQDIVVSWVGLECRLQQRLGFIVADTLEPRQDGRSRALVGMQCRELPADLLNERARLSLPSRSASRITSLVEA